MLFDAHDVLAEDEISLLCETQFVDEKPLKMGPEWFINIKPQSETMHLNWKNVLRADSD